MVAASNDMLSSVQLPSVSTLAIACACVLTVTAAPAQEQPDPATGEATFNVFLRSTPAGVERTLVTRTASGWVIQSTGQFFPPIDLKTQRFEAEYDTEWQPLRLAIDSVRAGKTYALETVFSNGTATSIIREGILETTRREPVDAATVVLPNYFFTFAAYEALAVRLHGSQPGDVLPVYVTPSGQIAARVNEVLTRQLETAERTLTVRILPTRTPEPRTTVGGGGLGGRPPSAGAGELPIHFAGGRAAGRRADVYATDKHATSWR